MTAIKEISHDSNGESRDMKGLCKMGADLFTNEHESPNVTSEATP